MKWLLQIIYFNIKVNNSSNTYFINLSEMQSWKCNGRPWWCCRGCALIGRAHTLLRSHWSRASWLTSAYNPGVPSSSQPMPQAGLEVIWLSDVYIYVQCEVSGENFACPACPPSHRAGSVLNIYSKYTRYWDVRLVILENLYLENIPHNCLVLNILVTLNA